MSVTAKATVTLTFEFDLRQPWSSEATIAELQKQAHAEAQEIGNNMICRITQNYESKNHAPPRMPHSVRVVSSSKTVEVILPEPGAKS